MLDSEVMLAAASELRLRGMCRDALVDPSTGSVCALGAVYVAQMGEWWIDSSPTKFSDEQFMGVVEYVGAFCDERRSFGWLRHRLRHRLVDANNDQSSTTERIASLFELAADCRRVEELQTENQSQVKEIA